MKKDLAVISEKERIVITDKSCPAVVVGMYSQGPAGPGTGTGTASGEWLHGVSAPTNAQGADGDMYYVETSGAVHKKIAGAWVFQFTVGSAISGTYEHTQAAASATWVVSHNLNFKPNVAVKTTGGVEVMAEVLHNSVNQTTIYFDAPMTGTASFS